MATYRVAFDGKWQERFHDRDEALQWAREVADTGRLVYVAERGRFFPRLAAVFPESKAEAGRSLWHYRDNPIFFAPRTYLDSLGGQDARDPEARGESESRRARDARDWEARGECPACAGGVVWTDGRCSHCGAVL